MHRIVNSLIALMSIIVLFLPMLLIYILLLFQKNGSPIFWSNRVGVNNIVFKMPKFRTMYVEAPIVSTDKLDRPNIFITPLGSLLRRSSLDELPQIYSVLIGHMNIVGPRPALDTQTELINLRIKYKIHTIRPGLTGLAQISGRDYLSNEEKVNFDYKYLTSQSLKLDVIIILKTFIKVFKNENIKF